MEIIDIPATPELTKIAPEPTVDVVPEADKNLDIDVLLQKVRGEEKAKLYPQLKSVKADLATKNVLVESLQAKIKELEVKMSNIDTTVTAIKDPVTIPEITEKVMDGSLTIGDLKAKIERLEAISAENVELSKKLTELQENVEGYKLGILLGETKKSLVGELDEEFQDLLTGNTVEELHNSFKMLKEKQDKIITKYRPNNPLPMPNGNMLKEIMSGGKDVKSMNNEEYEKVRQALGLGK